PRSCSRRGCASTRSPPGWVSCRATTRSRSSRSPGRGRSDRSSRGARSRSKGSRGRTRTSWAGTRPTPTSSGRSSPRSTATPPPNGFSAQQTLVVASLVQAEGTAADAPNIAAVIVNRLRRGMALQIDATLCYAKGGCPPVPSAADESIDSPYNTYRVTGLPPTPIMTVGVAALRAAIQPAAVPYLYYVTGKDGVTRFATTNAEQQQNIRQYGVRGEG